MKKYLVFILFAFPVALFGQANGTEPPSKDFQKKVDGFLEKQLSDYTVSKDNLDASGDEYILDHKVKFQWTKKITLKRKASFVNKWKQTVYQRLFFSFYKYGTANECKAATDSLLQRFGLEFQREAIKWGDNIKSLKTVPSIYLINNTEIIVCIVFCEHINDNWKEIQEDIKTTFGNDEYGTITTGCGGPLLFNDKSNKQ